MSDRRMTRGYHWLFVLALPLEGPLAHGRPNFVGLVPNGGTFFASSVPYSV